MYPALVIERHGSFRGEPFYHLLTRAGTLLASGPWDHIANCAKSYMR